MKSSSKTKHEFLDTSLDPQELGFLSFSPYEVKGAPAGESSSNLVKVRIPGDGNCGFYSLAFSVINSLVQNKLPLDKRHYDVLLELLKSREGRARKNIQARLNFYKNGTLDEKTNFRLRFGSLAPVMESILTAFDTSRLDDVDSFKKYILDSGNCSYTFRLSLIVVLGIALRQLSVERYDKEFKDDAFVEPPLRNDGVDADYTQLNLAAGFFGIGLNVYQGNMRKPVFSSYGETDKQSKEVMKKASESAEDTLETKGGGGEDELFSLTTNILNSSDKGSHWDVVLPLAEILSPPYYFSDLRALNREELELKISYPETKQKEMIKFLRLVGELKDNVDKLPEGEGKKRGLRLVTILNSNALNIFLDDDNDMGIKAYKKDCYLNCADEIVEYYNLPANNDRTIKNILANIALFIAMLGVGYLLAGTVHYCHTGRFTFFHKPEVKNLVADVSKELYDLYQKENFARVGKTTQTINLDLPLSKVETKAWSSVSF
jgi:hypothetical protein